MEILRLRAMERLHLTHDEWYALPLWERDTWVARVMYQDMQLQKLMESMIDKSKRQLKSPHLAAAFYALQSQMV